MFVSSYADDRRPGAVPWRGSPVPPRARQWFSPTGIAAERSRSSRSSSGGEQTRGSGGCSRWRRCGPGPVPDSRWDQDTSRRSRIPHRSSFLEHRQVRRRLLRVLSREAIFIDPQHGLLLETAWEAIEERGTPHPERLRGDVGWGFVGFHQRLFAAPGDPEVARATAIGSPGMPPASRRRPASPTISSTSRPEHDRRHGLLVLAGGRAPGVQEPAGRRVRDGDRGRVDLILLPEVSRASHRPGSSPLTADAASTPWRVAASRRRRGRHHRPRPSPAPRQADAIHVVRGRAVVEIGEPTGAAADRSAQDALLHKARPTAGSRPDGSTMSKAHSTGTLLGDPIEASTALEPFLPMAGSRDPCASAR